MVVLIAMLIVPIGYALWLSLFRDQLIGGNRQNDRLIGGNGNDTLLGGNDNDVCSAAT